MTKKKNKKNVSQDFTINDCANAPKPVKAIRKPVSVIKPDMEPSWDDLGDDTEILAEIDEDGNKRLVYNKKKKDKTIGESTGVEYPEILFYLLSKYIKPEDIGTFARINKSAYEVTKSKAFWILQYKRYCENHPKLPDRLRTDSLKAYGLRQTVIRALYHTYDKFNRKICREVHPNILVSWVCVNVWYNRGLTYWNVYFKLRKPQVHNTQVAVDKDLIEELGRIDANSEEGAQVLMLFGIAIIGLGSAAHVQLNKIHEITPVNLSFLSISVIVIGCIIFVIAFCACCGAMTENRCMLVCYAVFMGILAAIKIYITVVIFSFLNAVQATISEWLFNAFEDDRIRPAFNAMETLFQCCGTVGSGAYIVTGQALPPSCCYNPDMVADQCTMDNAYDGCNSRVGGYFDTFGGLTGGILIGVIIVEIICMIASLFLACRINQERSKRYA